MQETELYPPVKRYLEAQGYEVKGEIRECDIVALRGNDAPLIVELKTGFSLSLVLQGVDRQGVTDAVYLAFPPPKRRQRSDILHLCRRLGLGVLLVSGRDVEPLLDPAPYKPRKAPARKSMLLKEFARRVGDTTSGGSARTPRITAYRQDALRCLAHIAGEGPSKPAVIRRSTGVVRAPGILQRDVYGWFQRQQRGIYELSPKGTAALATFETAITALSLARAA